MLQKKSQQLESHQTVVQYCILAGRFIRSFILHKHLSLHSNRPLNYPREAHQMA